MFRPIMIVLYVAAALALMTWLMIATSRHPHVGGTPHAIAVAGIAAAAATVVGD